MPTEKIDNLLWFFDVGLSGKDEVVNGQQMKTLGTLLQDNKHTQAGIL